MILLLFSWCKYKIHIYSLSLRISTVFYQTHNWAQCFYLDNEYIQMFNFQILLLFSLWQLRYGEWSGEELINRQEQKQIGPGYAKICLKSSLLMKVQCICQVECPMKLCWKLHTTDDIFADHNTIKVQLPNYFAMSDKETNIFHWRCR